MFDIGKIGACDVWLEWLANARGAAAVEPERGVIVD